MTPVDADAGPVTVVGSDGVLGAALRRHLGARGLLLRCPPGAEADPVPELAGCRVAVNAAGPRVRPGLSWADYFREHVGTATRVARALPAGSHLVHLSSTAVYGTRGARLDRATPEAPLRFPNPSYASAKLAAETAVRQVCAERGVGLTVLRLSTVYGAGIDSVLSTLLRLARRGACLQLRPAAARQHWLHIDLLRAASARLVERGPQGLLLLADPFVLTSADLARLARRAAPRAAPVPVPAGWMGRLVRRWPAHREPPGALAAFAVLALDNQFDWRPAFEALDLDPTDFDRDAALAHLEDAT